MSAARKEQQLEELVGRYNRILVAFSGGVDSSYLAFTADRVLGSKALAVTALSPAVSTYQRRLADNFVAAFRINHRFVQTREMDDPNYTSNPANRCFFCKHELYTRLQTLSAELETQVVFDGSNRDDLRDYRPGRAAAALHGVISPLEEVGMHKTEIRQLSRKWGLPTWALPAMPCLSSRFPYGVPVTPGGLEQVERAEDMLRELGFGEFRVRHHGATARLEIRRDEMSQLDSGMLARIEARFRQLGYDNVEVDPRGFRSGSLNEVLAQRAAPVAITADNKQQRGSNR